MIYEVLHERMAEDDGMISAPEVMARNYTGRERREDHEARRLYKFLPPLAKDLGVNPEDVALYLTMPDVRTFYKKIIEDFRHEPGETTDEKFKAYASAQIRYINSEMIEIGNASGEGFAPYC